MISPQHFALESLTLRTTWAIVTTTCTRQGSGNTYNCTAALDFWFLGLYGGITVLTDSDTLVTVCPINAIVVLVKSWFSVVLPMVFWLFRKCPVVSGTLLCTTTVVLTCFFSSRHIVNAAVNAVHYSSYSTKQCRKKPF